MSNALLIDIDQVVEYTGAELGTPLRFSEFLIQPKRFDAVVIGAPVDIGSYEPGARFGPAEVRAGVHLPYFGLLGGTSSAFPFHFEVPSEPEQPVLLDIDMRRSYRERLPELADVGDVWHMAGESIFDYGARLEWAIAQLLQRSSLPILLGGDHSITLFALNAVFAARPKVGVIHFDAHHDLNATVSSSFRYLNHSRPFLYALESSSLAVLHQIGLRTLEPTYASFIARDPRLSFVSAREVQQLQPVEVFAGLPRDIPYYLTFDADCLSPDVAPETGTPEVGGLSYYQAVDLVDYAAREFELVGCDFVEVGMKTDGHNRAARAVGRLVERVVLRKAPFEPLDSYQRRRMFRL